MFSPFSTGLRQQQKILACFVPWSSNSKMFSPLALNTSYFLKEHQWTFEPFVNSCVWVPQLSSVSKDGSQNHTVTAGKGSNMQNMLENWRFRRNGGFFWRTVLSLTEQNKQRDSRTTTKQKQSWIIQVTTHSIKNQGCTNFWMGLF